MKVDWGMDSKDHMFSQASLRMWAILLGEEVGGSSVEGRSCVRRDLVDGRKSFASLRKEGARMGGRLAEGAGEARWRSKEMWDSMDDLREARSSVGWGREGSALTRRVSSQ